MNAATMTDAQLARRAGELYVHLIECAIDPDHPASRANRAREREARAVAAAIRRRTTNTAATEQEG